jgi:hypothetical protein
MLFRYELTVPTDRLKISAMSFELFPCLIRIDKNLLSLEGSIRRVDLYVKKILTTRC